MPLGPWGVLAIAVIDSSFFGMPLDAVVAAYVYSQPRLVWLYILVASVGSAVGSLVIYAIGYKGGEALLERRMPKARFEKIKASFDNHEFLALMVPALLPPPTPFKLIVLSAAAFEMSVRRFLLAIFLGRVVRFSILSVLVLVFGPRVVDIFSSLVRQHLLATLLVIAAIVAAGILWMKLRRPRQNGKAVTANT